MAIYGTKTVYDAALERIDYLFDEFENVIVTFSGGKDSTLALHKAVEKEQVVCLITLKSKSPHHRPRISVRCNLFLMMTA